MRPNALSNIQTARAPPGPQRWMLTSSALATGVLSGAALILGVVSATAPAQAFICSGTNASGTETDNGVVTATACGYAANANGANATAVGSYA